jgi:SAM-dependent methyltransferase
MNNNQKTKFLAGEGDAYFARNKSVLENGEDEVAVDPVLPILRGLHPFPERVLEIGCANGWRLNRMLKLGAKLCHGIDPSGDAIKAGMSAFPSLHLAVGSADTLPFADAAFDLVVFGFCLYLCDPTDHMRIVAEADRVLADQGHLVTFDFNPPAPYRNSYAHSPGLFSYKMDFSRLFLAHPHYQILEKKISAHNGIGKTSPDNRVAVSLLTKDLLSAWPVNPWDVER